MNQKYIPHTMVAAGIVSTVAAVVTTAVCTVKAVTAVLNYADEQGKSLKDVSKKELFKVAGKYYIVPLTLTVFSGCMTGFGFSKELKNESMIAAAANVVTTAAREYEETAVKKLGEATDKEIREETQEEKVREDFVSNETEIIFYDTGMGKTCLYEPLTGTYFLGDIGLIRRKVLDLDEMAKNASFGRIISLEDFFSEIRLPKCDVGHLLGWDMDVNGDLDVGFGPLKLPNGDYIDTLIYKRDPIMI